MERGGPAPQRKAGLTAGFSRHTQTASEPRKQVGVGQWNLGPFPRQARQGGQGRWLGCHRWVCRFRTAQGTPEVSPAGGSLP